MSLRIVAQVELARGLSEAQSEEVRSALASCAGTLDEVARSHAGRHAAGSVGGGDLTWDLLFANEDACAAFCSRRAQGDAGLLGSLGPQFADLHEKVAGVTAAVVEPISSELREPGLVGIKRTLWLRVFEDAPADRLALFERHTPLLAADVPAIRNWSFSRVRTAPPNPGPIRWTHLWEQEFATVEGLERDYMASPYHWGYIDGFFDPEHPGAIVDPRLCHLYCPATESVLSWALEGTS